MQLRLLNDACGTNPGHQAPNILSINTLPGHQALNLKSKSSQGIKPSTRDKNIQQLHNIASLIITT
ncbi:hypothetical protein MTR_0111s0030 [Medicago truncatula]|uniref:Uncharacterized protein n=1 Tax=Medicago truncatula TaxID=3880 RepID=A0A072THK9_MEDTR|nr:hypothetical protein MTR_0111s0030 [Medicago truncatula]